MHNNEMICYEIPGLTSKIPVFFYKRQCVFTEKNMAKQTNSPNSTQTRGRWVGKDISNENEVIIEYLIFGWLHH